MLARSGKSHRTKHCFSWSVGRSFIPCQLHRGHLTATKDTKHDDHTGSVSSTSTRPEDDKIVAARLEAEVEAQRRFFKDSQQTMAISYCRDHREGGRGTHVKRWLRRLTIDANYDFRHWRKHQRATRHLGIWTRSGMMRSDNMRRLWFPDLCLLGTISSCFCYFNAFVASPEAVLTLPMECFTVTSMALGLLVTFKTQTGYSRFSQARSLWAKLANDSRAMSSRILTRVPSQVASSNHDENDAYDVLRGQLQALKLIRTFPLVLKYHVTEDGCNPHIHVRADMPEAELRASTSWALRAELEQIWSVDDDYEHGFVHRLLGAEIPNKPLYVLHELGHINATVFCNPKFGGLDGPAATEMDKSITSFHHVFGECDQILRTPIYTPYTKFTSRFLALWCGSLPLALYPLLGPIGTVPMSLIISFFMFGIEDIGSRVEQPFDVLPVWQYCHDIDQSCLQVVRHSEVLRQISEASQFDSDYGQFDGRDDDSLCSIMDPL